MPGVVDVEFYWEDYQLDVDAVSRPSIDTTFFLSNFNDFEKGSLTEKTMLIDKEQDNENSLPPCATTPIAGRPNPPA